MAACPSAAGRTGRTPAPRACGALRLAGAGRLRHMKGGGSGRAARSNLRETR